MNLPDLLCDLGPPSSLSGTQLPTCGIRIQFRPGHDLSPRWPLVPSAASYPCPQEWGSVGLRDLGDASYDEPSAPLPEGPLPTGVPHTGRSWALPQGRSPRSSDPCVSAPLELGVAFGNPSSDQSLSAGTDHRSEVAQETAALSFLRRQATKSPFFLWRPLLL